MSFTQQTNRGVVFHTADAFSAAGGIAHGFATRIGGVSKPPFDQLNLGMIPRMCWKTTGASAPPLGRTWTIW